jgi:hypothetical protein
MRAGKLFALASVEIDIDGVRIEVRGIRAMRVPTGGTRVELPTFRDAAGQSRAATVLPDEVHGPIGDAVIEALIERVSPSDGSACRSRIDPPADTFRAHIFRRKFPYPRGLDFERFASYPCDRAEI